MSTLVLTRSQTRKLLAPGDLLPVLRSGFCAHSLHCETEARRVSVELGDRAPQGAGIMLIAPGLLPDIPAYTVKVHAKFPGHDPAIQGVIVLNDLATGHPLAIMDSTYITELRTGAACALAADLLARRDASIAAIIGAGVQGVVQLESLLLVRSLRHVRVYDIEPQRAESFARAHAERLRVSIAPVGSLEAAIDSADIIVTATWAKKPFLFPGMIVAGAHITTLGADQPGKAELSGDLLRQALFVCDDRKLAVEMGAVGAAGLGPDAIHAELGEVIAGTRPGRTKPDQLTVFGSVGLAFQDLAAAWLIYRRAAKEDAGSRVFLLE